MTYTDTNYSALEPEAIDKSIRRARRLRARVMGRWMRRVVRRFNASRSHRASTPLRATVQPA